MNKIFFKVTISLSIIFLLLASLMNDTSYANTDENNLIFYSQQAENNNNSGGGGFPLIISSNSVLPYIKEIGKDPNKVSHILAPKHNWKKVSSGKWSDVERIMSAVMRYGKEVPYKKSGTIRQKIYSKYGHTFVVTFKRENGKIRVSNVWVKK